MKKSLAATIHGEQANLVQSLSQKAGRPPGLAVILVGDDPASHTYVANKRKACQKFGIYAPDINLPATASTEAILEAIDSFNRDQAIDGILVQLPLPSHVAKEKVLLRISPDKDVDGLHPANLGRLVTGEPGLVACTLRGIITLLDHFKISIAGETRCRDRKKSSCWETIVPSFAEPGCHGSSPKVAVNFLPEKRDSSIIRRPKGGKAF